VHQVGHYPELHQDAGQQNIKKTVSFIRHLRYLQECILSAALCFQTRSVSVSSHWSVSYVNLKKKNIKPKIAFLSSRKCLNASFYEDYSGAKTYYETCNSPGLVNSRTSNRTMDLFISHSLLCSSLAGSQNSAGLTEHFLFTVLPKTF
jgi:hypothetical protein